MLLEGKQHQTLMGTVRYGTSCRYRRYVDTFPTHRQPNSAINSNPSVRYCVGIKTKLITEDGWKQSEVKYVPNWLYRSMIIWPTRVDWSTMLYFLYGTRIVLYYYYDVCVLYGSTRFSNTLRYCTVLYCAVLCCIVR